MYATKNSARGFHSITSGIVVMNLITEVLITIYSSSPKSKKTPSNFSSFVNLIITLLDGEHQSKIEQCGIGISRQ